MAKMGRPRYVRDDLTASKVENLATVGTPHKDIALIMGMSLKTLLKYYDAELALGKAKGNAGIGGVLFKAAQRGEAWAVCFWLKTQAGWRESSLVQTQQLGKDGNPIDPPKFGISFANGGPGIAVSDEQRAQENLDSLEAPVEHPSAEEDAPLKH